MSKEKKFVIYILNCLFLFSAIFYGQKNENVFKPTDKTVVISNSSTPSAEILENSLKVDFEISFAKNELLLLEPLLLNAKFSNQTERTIEIFEPNLINQLGMKLVFDEKIYEGRKLFSHYISRPNRTRLLNPGDYIEEFVVLEPGASLFPSVGNYEVQFFISYGENKIWSNAIAISVREPLGLDKEAYDFLLSNLGSEFDLFGSSDHDMAGTQALLEGFIKKFASSRYHDYAVLSLSNLYKINKNFEMAKYELLKLGNTHNELLNNLVKKRLIDLPDNPF